MKNDILHSAVNDDQIKRVIFHNHLIPFLNKFTGFHKHAEDFFGRSPQRNIHPAVSEVSMAGRRPGQLENLQGLLFVQIVRSKK